MNVEACYIYRKIGEKIAKSRLAQLHYSKSLNQKIYSKHNKNISSKLPINFNTKFDWKFKTIVPCF